MSKNTASNEFRKVNVDAFDEENYEDEVVSGADHAAAVSAREAECRTLLNADDKERALRAALAPPPYGAPASVKDSNLATVMGVLLAFKASEVAAAAATLTPTELDTLMKYVYRGMEEPEAKKCAALLAWHAAGVEKGGSGCILRVLTSRESV